MKCQTIKEGHECLFAGKKGCTYTGGTCYEVVEACQGCGKEEKFGQGVFCKSCPNPGAKWRNGPCNLATHVMLAAEKNVKVNPLKANKRARRKGK